MTEQAAHTKPANEETPPCRLRVVVASQAPTAVVFRRGPSQWWHLLRWDLAALSLEPGAWLKGQLYPRRSNISPDGALLSYFALKGKWGAYFAVSKAPWITALAAWKTGTTYTTGSVFGPGNELALFGAFLDGQPFHGRYPWPVETRGLYQWRHGRYFNEYTRGWQALEGAAAVARLHQLQALGLQFPPHKDPPILIERRSDRHKRTVGVCDTTDLMSSVDDTDHEATYYLTTRAHDPELLPGVRWADWDADGRLLTATHSGKLQVFAITRHRRQLAWEHDLNGLTPQPAPAPEWARSW